MIILRCQDCGVVVEGVEPGSPCRQCDGGTVKLDLDAAGRRRAAKMRKSLDDLAELLAELPPRR